VTSRAGITKILEAGCWARREGQREMEEVGGRLTPPRSADGILDISDGERHLAPDEVVIDTEENEPGRGEKMDEGMRWFGDFFFKPILWPFSKLSISPNLITLAGIGFALAAGYYLAVQNVGLAAVMFVISGVLDLVDGYVAKRLDRMTAVGAFLDSFSDRISDAAIYIGLMVYFMKQVEGIYAGLALVCFVLSFLISYLRAKAESLGISGKGGLMARPQRFLLLGAGLFFNALSPWVLRTVLWLLAVLLLETLAERFVRVWRALAE
jgi:CDP-diacylglycerol--glycerol-3-phosphate 3-phosphatidyltransferase